jgi:Flp pilus assembly protein TadG
MKSRITSHIRALRRNASGIAAAEFALIAPVMVTLLLSTYDVGNAVQQQLQLQQALRAAGQYAMSFPTQTGGLASTNNGIVLAVQQALPTTLLPSVTTLTATPDAGPPYIITLNVALTYKSFLLPISRLSASYHVRIQ